MEVTLERVESIQHVVVGLVTEESGNPIPGVNIEALAAAVNAHRDRPVHVVSRVDEMARAVADIARDGDLVLTLGAGSISSLAPALVAELESRHRSGGVR